MLSFAESIRDLDHDMILILPVPKAIAELIKERKKHNAGQPQPERV